MVDELGTVVVEVFVIVSGQRRAMGALALIFWLCAGGKEATPSLYVLTYRQNLFVVSFRLPFTRIYVVRVGAGGEVSDECSKSYVGSSISADDVSDEA